MADEKQYILLVEDDQFLAEIYRTAFEQEGFKISTEQNGEDGLAAVKKKKPDLVVLDILLPKMNGFEVLEYMKNDNELKDIPVVLVTGLGQKDDVDRGLALGASEYLIKTHFRPAEIVRKIKHILNH